MTNKKYYDWYRRVALDPQKDGCLYKEWATSFKDFPFTVHPKGFLMFLSPAELQACDEYEEGDPYEVQKGLEGHFQQRRIQCTLELIRSIVPETGKGVRMLDLGCGQGHITAKIKEAFPMAEISGFDYSTLAISHAVEAFEDIDFAVADAANAPYSEGYFDVVICNNLWEHVPNPLQMLERIRQILKVGGHVIISTPSRYRLENLIKVLRGKPVKLASQWHVTEYSVGQVVEQLEFERFEVIKIYTKPLRPKYRGVVRRLIISIIRLFFKVIRSHHTLESTIFFLARKRE